MGTWDHQRIIFIQRINLGPGKKKISSKRQYQKEAKNRSRGYLKLWRRAPVIPRVLDMHWLLWWSHKGQKLPFRTGQGWIRKSCPTSDMVSHIQSSPYCQTRVGKQNLGLGWPHHIIISLILFFDSCYVNILLGECNFFGANLNTYNPSQLDRAPLPAVDVLLPPQALV